MCYNIIKLNGIDRGRDMVVRWLEKHGIDCSMQNNGSDALAIAYVFLLIIFVMVGVFTESPLTIMSCVPIIFIVARLHVK